MNDVKRSGFVLHVSNDLSQPREPIATNVTLFSQALYYVREMYYGALAWSVVRDRSAIIFKFQLTPLCEWITGCGYWVRKVEHVGQFRDRTANAIDELRYCFIGSVALRRRSTRQLVARTRITVSCRL